jgi:acyl dehydratase
VPFPGEIFSKRHVFTAEDIADFAARAGDWNALHHDADKAAETRFGGLIASGTQTAALLMGLVASHLSKTHEPAGLEFSFRFRRAVPAGTEAILSWQITAIEPSPKLGGDLVILAGEISDDAGRRFVSSEGRAVIWSKGYAPRPLQD